MTLQEWEVLGTWVSGLATLFVGLVALYTARPKLKPSLNITCGLMIGYGSLEGQEVIVINVTNLAPYPIVINTIGWQFPTSKLLAWQQLSNTNIAIICQTR